MINIEMRGMGQQIPFDQIEPQYKKDPSTLPSRLFCVFFISCYSHVVMLCFSPHIKHEGRTYINLIREFDGKGKINIHSPKNVSPRFIICKF